MSSVLLDPDGTFSAKFEAAVDMAGNVLVVEGLELSGPWADPLIAASLVSSLIDRLADNGSAVVLPAPAPTWPAPCCWTRRGRCWPARSSVRTCGSSTPRWPPRRRPRTGCSGYWRSVPVPAAAPCPMWTTRTPGTTLTARKAVGR
ncbi:hypothetical protein [Kitasatospora paranensis]|uniref:hypothetical protein n=1 Tax=Kitasatospora paranensis TaxID=258053 RepID=UPI0031F18F48